jgi:hypothetical protein
MYAIRYVNVIIIYTCACINMCVRYTPINHGVVHVIGSCDAPLVVVHVMLLVVVVVVVVTFVMVVVPFRAYISVYINIYMIHTHTHIYIHVYGWGGLFGARRTIVCIYGRSKRSCTRTRQAVFRYLVELLAEMFLNLGNIRVFCVVKCDGGVSSHPAFGGGALSRSFVGEGGRGGGTSCWGLVLRSVGEMGGEGALRSKAGGRRSERREEGGGGGGEEEWAGKGEKGV